MTHAQPDGHGWFGDPADVEEPEEASRRFVAEPWMRVPLEFVPTSLALTELIGITTDGIGVVLTTVEVFPTGLTFHLLAVPEPGNETAREAADAHRFYGDMAGFSARRLSERLRIGVQYDDGRTATNQFIHGPEEATEPPAAVLRIVTASGGGDSDTKSEHWAWPIPEHGDLTLVFAWVARGIEERRVVLSGDELRAAAARSRAREIWPGAKLPPPTPPDGW